MGIQTYQPRDHWSMEVGAHTVVMRKDTNGMYVLLSDHLAAITAKDEEIKELREALRGVNDLFREPSPFYIKKLGGGITNGDQKRIDDVFIAIDAALRKD